MKLENKVLQTLTQQQKLSLKQQYDLKILEMNNEDLLSCIEQELESNPLLEYDDIYATSSSRKNDSTYDLILNYIVQEESLSEQLEMQVDTYPNPIRKDLAYFIINSLDSNGYLTLLDGEILRYFPSYTLDDIEDTISIIQTFEPAGICCRNLQECLLIQLCFQDMPYSQIAIMIVNFYLQEVGENKLPFIAKELNISVHEVDDAIHLIKSLNPKPGANYATSSAYVRPDVKVDMEDNELKITLFLTSYGIRYNTAYSESDEKQMKEYIKLHKKNAEQLLSGIEKRNSTLLKICEAIVRHQRDFFCKRMQLKPLNLKDIAIDLDIHESTVSRTIANKALVFNQQVMPLKFFFPTKISENTSSNELHLHIKMLIKEEDKKKPLSDQDISDTLQKLGKPLSRRTVAKYREQLKIPVASKRRVY